MRKHVVDFVSATFFIAIQKIGLGEFIASLSLTLTVPWTCSNPNQLSFKGLVPQVQVKATAHIINHLPHATNISYWINLPAIVSYVTLGPNE
jgi:hypothetical protein